MNKTGKGILLLIAIVYFVSPVDLMPGIPVDDFAALALALTPFFSTNSEA